MSVIDSIKAYKAPQAEVVEANIQGVLCQSTGAVTIEDYTEEKLDW